MQLALFDFDHTITPCDTYSRFPRHVATPAQLVAAKWTVGPWLLGYRAGVVSAAGIRARATRVALAGRDAADVGATAARYAGQALPQLLRPEVMARIDWHRREGHDVVVVSGSLDLYLTPCCTQHGLALLCNRLETEEGRLIGRYAGSDLGPLKVRELLSRLYLSRS